MLFLCCLRGRDLLRTRKYSTGNITPANNKSNFSIHLVYGLKSVGPILYCVYVKSTMTIYSMSAVYTYITCVKTYNFYAALILALILPCKIQLGERMALWGKPHEPCTASCLHLYAMCR